MDGASRENFPKIPESSGKKVDRAIHGAAHRALMTAASIIWSFWANGQITGERRDYCYYTRPRTQSKPDYTLVSQSLSGLLLPVRLSELRCREGGGGPDLFSNDPTHTTEWFASSVSSRPLRQLFSLSLETFESLVNGFRSVLPSSIQHFFLFSFCRWICILSSRLEKIFENSRIFGGKISDSFQLSKIFANERRILISKL